MRSKTKIPILVGKPPHLPVTKPLLLTNVWRKQAKLFAEYFLILYRPWSVKTIDGGTLPGDCTWNSFCRFMRHLDGMDRSEGKSSFVHSVRCQWISNAAHGLRTSASVRRAAQKYRCRSATLWNTPNNSERLSKHSRSDDVTSEHNIKRREEEEAAKKAQEAIDVMRAESAMNEESTLVNSRKLEYYDETKKILQTVFNGGPEETSPLDLATARKVVCQETEVNDVDMSNIVQQLRSEESTLFSANEGHDVQQFPSDTSFLQAAANETKLSQRLNHTQKKVWEEIRHYFQCLRLFKDGMGKLLQGSTTVLVNDSNTAWINYGMGQLRHGSTTGGVNYSKGKLRHGSAKAWVN